MRSCLLRRVGLLAATGSLLLGLPMCARDSSAPSDSIPTEGTTPDETATREALAATPLGHVVSRDARGAARWIVGAVEETPATVAASAETAARIHLSRHAAVLKVSEAAIHDLALTGSQGFAGGARVVQFAQRVNGMDVFQGRASVVLDGSKNLVSIGASLHPLAAATHAVKAMTFKRSAESVVADAYAGRFGVSLSAESVHDTGARSNDSRGYALATPKEAPKVLEASAKRVLFPEGEKLVPAYYVELLARVTQPKSGTGEGGAADENEGYGYAISADDGRVLYQTQLTASESFRYRVWADPAGNHIPADGPFVDATPHPTGFPDRAVPAYAAPILVSMDGFNKNPSGQADPWLAADATTTFGNNVRAYSDRNDTHTGTGDGFEPGVDLVADVTAAKTFDRTFDPNQQPNASPDQIKAATTQLFYVTNWLHDYWYDSGFNESAGVAQLVNFGRGGVEGDPLKVEAQDGADFGQANNANMFTPQDGVSPRMQMFVWSGRTNRTFTTVPARPYQDPIGAAVFGPQQFDVTAEAVLANDGTGTTSDACEAVTNVAGKIAVIDRGICPFTQKTLNAQNGGAVGVIMLNNVAGRVPVVPGGVDPSITIPVLGFSLEDGALLKEALGAGAVTAHIKRGAEVLLDGTIDNSIVAHEWGHYLHHRLVNCGSNSCRAMSEGWADFTALQMVIRESDLENELFGAAFPLAQYATSGSTPSAAYFGIRRAPYSANRAKNPFTFGHMRRSASLPTGVPLNPTAADMAQVHNVGEIWAQSMFEGYVNILKVGQVVGRSFEESKRRMADYVVAGMKAAPTEPTFAEQRDAILATVWAMGHKDDFSALARGFAKRGFGAGAVSPPTSSVAFEEAVENFDTRGKLALVDAKLDDSVSSCDRDGVLDAGETGKVTIRLRNLGWVGLTGSTVSVSTTDPSVTFLGGGTATVASIDPYGVGTATIQARVDRVPLARAELPVTVRIHNDNAIPADNTAVVTMLYNFDDVPNSSPIDNVESEKSPWTFQHGTPAFNLWQRQGDATNHVWHADDLGVISDESLVSPDLVVGTSELKITFKHRFQFEATPGIFWDGGVLEVSTDAGTTWSDISTYVDPRYPQTLTDSSGNVLGGRKAWAGDSAGYPNYETVSLNLGTQLQGKTIRIRFRAGTDESGGAQGWDIDQLIFSGLTNLPFPSIVDDRTTRCPRR